MLDTLTEWLDIRPGERRVVLLATLGAFLVVAFHITARALREAFFIDEFSVAAFPYVTMATALVNIPSVILFTRLLARRSPHRVYSATIVVVGIGLAVLYGITTWIPDQETVRPAATVAFFIWTAVGSLLVASGFWVLAAERFSLRDAKRLFGMISGGGTLGGLAGLAIGPLADRIGNGGLVLGLIGLLGVAWGVQFALARGAAAREVDARPMALGQNVRDLVTHPYLRSIAAIVAVATMASYLLDYQLKEFVEVRYPLDEDMAGFFGTFYGLTGVLALILQVFVASRLLAGAGVSWTLAILPAAIISGGVALFLAPGLLTATLVRGTDNTLRRSLHRSVIEYLFVPVPAALRRRTKSLIDSLVDNGAEGAAALLVSAWVALELSSRSLAFPLIALGLLFLWLTWEMGQRYMSTLLERLKEGRAALEEEDLPTDLLAGEMTVTMTRFDLSTLIDQSGLDVPATQPLEGPSDSRPTRTGNATRAQGSRLDRLQSADPEVVGGALAEDEPVRSEEIPVLLRLLARDTFSRRAGDLLAAHGNVALPALIDGLRDEDADFVIRRRIPRVLGRIDDGRADDALIDALRARRFEVRYRAGVALAQRRRHGLTLDPDAEERIWGAIDEELGRERPIWELQRLLDERPTRDDLVTDRVYSRGELSLEHTFRLLSLVLEPEPTRTAFFGIVLDEERLRGIALEYLEQVLPADIRKKLWPFIGDISEQQRKREIRDMDEVVADLLKTGATLFAGDAARARLREALEADSDGDDAE